MKSFQYTTNKKTLIVLLSITISICTINTLNNNYSILSYSRNNKELKKVLKHYKNDNKKYNAVLFLIKNMKNKYSYKLIVKDTLNRKNNFCLFDTHIDKNNYQSLLDSLNFHLEIDSINDMEHINAQYLIENCDYAFYAWENFPWSKGYTKSIFYEYILPYRINKENLVDWRSFFIKRYKPMIDTMKNEKTIKNISQLIIKDINKQISYSCDALNLKPSLDYKEILYYQKGNCSIIADIIVLALRSMGIASTKDYIPLWGSTDNGHTEVVYFDECCNPVMLQTGNWLAAHPPKIFRQIYSITESSNTEQFDNNNYIDVTNNYIPTTDIRISIKSIPEEVYLAVYNNNKWKEISKGSLFEKQLYLFHNMGRSIIYLPITKTNYNGIKAIDSPLSVDFLGNIRKYKINNESKVDINLTQYLSKIHIIDNIDNYELAYWNISHWSSIPISENKNTGFNAHQVPSNTIYTILDKRNFRLKGRIFTYDNNIIIW